jgi:NTF2 fold immunity protein
VLGEKVAKQEITEALKRNRKPFYDTLITDRETAIAMAEPLLFKICGKENIESERPYEIYLIDGYWYISGTLPKGYLGGTFIIIINSINGEVIRLIHEK